MNEQVPAADTRAVSEPPASREPNIGRSAVQQQCQHWPMQAMDGTDLLAVRKAQACCQQQQL